MFSLSCFPYSECKLHEITHVVFSFAASQHLGLCLPHSRYSIKVYKYANVFQTFFTLGYRKYNNICMVSGYIGRDLELSICYLVKKKVITFFLVFKSSKKKKIKCQGKY